MSLDAKDEAALARGINHLGATDIGGGYYAFPNPGPERHYIVASTAAVIACGEEPNDYPDYEAWFWGYDEIADMPYWWKPTMRVAWRVCDASGKPNENRYAAKAEAQLHAWDSRAVERVTVNLETGEEVAFNPVIEDESTAGHPLNADRAAYANGKRYRLFVYKGTVPMEDEYAKSLASAKRKQKRLAASDFHVLLFGIARTGELQPL